MDTTSTVAVQSTGPLPRLGSLLRSPRFADMLLVCVAVVWGSSYGVAKGALQYYPVIGFLAIRFCLTSVLLAPVWLRKSRASILATWRVGAPLGMILFAIFVCETFGVAMTRASNAAFLISLCVVFTPFIEAVVFRVRPSTGAVVAAAVSALGALLLTTDVEIHLNVGDGLMLVAAVLRACMVTVTKRLTQKTNIDSLSLTASQSGIVALGSLGLVVALPGSAGKLPVAPAFWLSALFLVVFCTILAFFAQNYAVRRTSPTRVSLLMGSEPVFGALFARLWLGDQLTASAWLGGSLIVGAALWATMRPAPNRALPAGG
jgi:drug/metabolite transporter (DMT)-like permease